jgi:hypothetical protein
VEQSPLTGDDLKRSIEPNPFYNENFAAVIAGLEQHSYSTWALRNPQTPPGMGPNTFIEWDADRARGATNWTAASLPQPIDPDQAQSSNVPLRISIHGNLFPQEIIPVLLRSPNVASVVVPVTRPPGSLRRRPWNWPFRIGITHSELENGIRNSLQRGIIPTNLVDVTDATKQPGAVDLLVIVGDLRHARSVLAAAVTTANLVIVLGDGKSPWPAIDAELAYLRAVTGAVASVIVDGPVEDTSLVGDQLLRIVRFLSHGHPIDVAITAAFDRNVIIVGELEALERASLPEQILDRGVQLRHDISFSGLVGEPSTENLLANYASIPSYQFDRESGAATAALMVGTEIDDKLDNDVASRAVQVELNPEADTVSLPTVASQNRLKPGRNLVQVFVGPQDTSALQASPITNEQMGIDESTSTARLTVVLVPLIPEGPPVRTEFEVPRTGRSQIAKLLWDIGEANFGQARLLILHRNRVLQTVLLQGQVNETAELRERLVLWDQYSNLDDRRPFDLAIVQNHDDNHAARTIAHASGVTANIGQMDEIDAVTESIRTQLVLHVGKSPALKGDILRKAFVELAVQGRDLYMMLRAQLGTNISQLERIQIVTARPTWFLPIEFIYDKNPPNPDAVLCPTWLANGHCTQNCDAGYEVVCPSVFWGLRKVIERHYVENPEQYDTTFVSPAHPKRNDRRLPVDTVALGASKIVTKSQMTETITSINMPRGPSTSQTTQVKSWDEWSALVAKGTTNLLLLMPHSSGATLEISGDVLPRGSVDNRYVTGAVENRHPAVVLFGCGTAGTEANPAGFAARFMQAGAGVVFAAFVDLYQGHAAQMTRDLDSLLRPNAIIPPRTIGEVLSEFRRQGAHKGLLSTLSITAYGDSDWTV